VPTLSEVGLTGFQSNTDYALYAPARTPKDIIALLNREMNVVLQQSDVRAKLAAQGIEVSGSSPEALHKELLEELAKWSKVIKTANINPE
jgi:tripartite-type tricarboxylate transporter receptor subunit TctC